MTGALDTTLSYGTLWRVQGQDMKHYKGSSTPNHDDVNTNDGNRAYDTGVVSQVFRISADLEVDWEDQYGFFYSWHCILRHPHDGPSQPLVRCQPGALARSDQYLSLW